MLRRPDHYYARRLVRAGRGKHITMENMTAVTDTAADEREVEQTTETADALEAKPTPKDAANANAKADRETDKPAAKGEDDPKDADGAGEYDADAEDTEDADDSAEVKALLAKQRATNREAQKLRDRAKTAEATIARYEACERAGLPLSMAKRLSGDTAEELDADAGELRKLLRIPSAPGAVIDDGIRRGDGADVHITEADHEKIGARIYR